VLQIQLREQNLNSHVVVSAVVVAS
jgi:hypothetical protein